MEKVNQKSSSDERSLLSAAKHYRQYSYRWLILVSFFLDTLINGIVYETCIPISAIVLPLIP